MRLPDALQSLVQELCYLPGVGEKTALRYALFLAKENAARISRFSKSIEGLLNLKKCAVCGVLAHLNICEICQCPERSKSLTICVVEDISDYMAIEKGGLYRGKYHVLGGILNPLLGVSPEDINIEQLIKRVAQENISEVILALNPSVEGDATCTYIKLKISDYKGQNISIDRLAIGLPMGGALEFQDSLTISKAFENKKAF